MKYTRSTKRWSKRSQFSLCFRYILIDLKTHSNTKVFPSSRLKLGLLRSLFRVIMVPLEGYITGNKRSAQPCSTLKNFGQNVLISLSKRLPLIPLLNIVPTYLLLSGFENLPEAISKLG